IGGCDQVLNKLKKADVLLSLSATIAVIGKKHLSVKSPNQPKIPNLINIIPRKIFRFSKTAIITNEKHQK
ncbi:hypothetical protein ACFLXU_03200, partial [Chloroflexota bacterium]